MVWAAWSIFYAPQQADTWADQGSPEPLHPPHPGWAPGGLTAWVDPAPGLGWETVSLNCACVMPPTGGAVGQEGARPCSERSCAVTGALPFPAQLSATRTLRDAKTGSDAGAKASLDVRAPVATGASSRAASSHMRFPSCSSVPAVWTPGPLRARAQPPPQPQPAPSPCLPACKGAPG